MSHEIELCGCLTIPEDANWDEVADLFLNFVESHGWYYCGDFAEIRDGKQVGYGVIKKENEEKNYGEEKSI